MPLETFRPAVDWVNQNQGVLSLILFVATLFLGWFSGIFSSLRRRPKFQIRLLEGPTFCCIYENGSECNGYKTHQVAVALYLKVANIGSAASSIESVQVGYHWNLLPFRKDWWRHTVGWFWLERLSVALEDFQIKIGDSLKVFPFLFQKTHLSQISQDTYLEPGKSVLGVVYFEQAESWGGCQPKPESGSIEIKIRADDTFGKAHYLKARVPLVTLAEARKFNPSFGKTFSNLAGTTLPFDYGI